MPTDHIFYELLRTAPDIFLKLIGQQANQTYEFQAPEVKQTAFRLDGILLPKVESEQNPVIVVEVQFQHDTNFYRRFFSEIFLFLRHNPNVQHWQAAAIFEKRSREPVDQTPFQVLLESPQIHRIYLEDFKKVATDSIGEAILQLIVTKPKSAVSRAKALIARTSTQSDTQSDLQSDTQSEMSLSPSQILGLIETIMVYKFPNLEREVIAAMLGIDSVKQTRVYKDALIEGRQEGQCELILRLLRRKLDELPDSLVSKIEKLSNQQLETLGDRIFDLSSLDDLTNDLAKIQPNETPVVSDDKTA
ncbi:MAG: Rpn family recombination-promoting nuclease/putative transposase [Cyanobacteria bacterium J06627_28]